MARLHRDILRTLLGRIAAGDPPVGAKLSKEVDLAAELGEPRRRARVHPRARERGVVRHPRSRGGGRGRR